MNSSIVNAVPLSETKMSGSPYVANMVLSFSMITVDVTEPITARSIHVEWASIKIRNSPPPRKGPA